MKAVLEDMKSGKVMAYEVPQPELRDGGILVRTAFSAISSGTERAKLEAGEKSLVGKAMSRPDLVRQVVDFARNEGINVELWLAKRVGDSIQKVLEAIKK